jgi:hypothetical protein
MHSVGDPDSPAPPGVIRYGVQDIQFGRSPGGLTSAPSEVVEQRWRRRVGVIAGGAVELQVALEATWVLSCAHEVAMNRAQPI